MSGLPTLQDPPRGRVVGRLVVRLLLVWAASLALLVVAVPLTLRVGAAGTALRFLAELLSDGGRPWLSAGTLAPSREAIRLEPAVPADLWRPGGPPPHRGLVLVHGLTAEGKDDPRLRWAAGLLTRGGLAVMVPDLPALRQQRLRPEDGRVVTAAAARLAASAGVHGEALTFLAVSVGSAPALAAAVDPAVVSRVRLVVTLGGYAEARELIRYFTTGAYGFAGISGRARFDPGVTRSFLALNLDIVRDPREREAVSAALAGRPLPAAAGSEARAILAVLTNQDPARVDPLLAALPAETRVLLDALSPARHVSRLRARLVLVHGRDDPAVPVTESLRLAAAAHPDRTRLVLVDLLSHIEGRLPTRRQLGDLLQLWGAVYEIFRG